MMLMGAEPARVMWLDGEKWMSLAVQFRDGRCATLSCFAGGSPFVTNVSLRSGNRLITVESDFFAAFIEELCRFYQTGEVRVPHRETLAIMAVRGAGLLAAKTPGVWVAQFPLRQLPPPCNMRPGYAAKAAGIRAFLQAAGPPKIIGRFPA